MMRRLGAASAVLTILVGLLMLPHTHMHASAASVADAHHAHHAPLVHTHVTPHHHEAEPAGEATDDESEAQQIRSIDAFVFQPGSTPSSPTPVLIATTFVQFEIPKLSARVIAAHPPAHGPPVALASGLRAPPLAPPALF